MSDDRVAAELLERIADAMSVIRGYQIGLGNVLPEHGHPDRTIMLALADIRNALESGSAAHALAKDIAQADVAVSWGLSNAACDSLARHLAQAGWQHGSH